MPPAGAPLPMSNLTSPPPMPPFPMLLVDLPRWRRHAREREVPSIIRGRLRLRRRLGYLSAYIFVCLTDAELLCLRVSLRGDDDVADVSLAAAAWSAAAASAAIRDIWHNELTTLYPPYLSPEKIGAEFPFYAF